ncbi:ribonuclease H-like domain-containing protein [Tanacetum coccineum]
MIVKLPILKQENGNSFVPITTTTAEGTTTTSILVTVEEKTKKKNDVKARSMLLMVLPNEHQLTFNQYNDAKSLFAAIEARFGGNEATKKIQKTLLKQMYENFSASGGESLDCIFNRLQKLMSQLAILGVDIAQQDLNPMFLICLPSEWNTHIMVWQNKPDLDIMSIDDLYNNFKIVKQEPASTQVSTASSHVSTANLSDATVYAFLSNQTNMSQLAHKDLEQIHKDDVEEIDLKCDTAGFDKSKVECFNCHKMTHFARECRGPRNQDTRNRYQDVSKRTMNVEETPSKAMVAIDGIGFDWSYMAEEEVPTNMALMAFSNYEVHNNNTCSKTYLKSYETLKKQYDDLRINFNKVEFDLVIYKRGLASVEEQLAYYKNNESNLCENVAVLTRDMMFKDSEISNLKSKLEKVKKEKEGIQYKITNFNDASKSLDKLLGSQVTDNNKHGLGCVSYNIVPPPATLVYNTGNLAPSRVDLSYSGLEEFKQPEFKGYGSKSSEKESQNVCNEPKVHFDAPFIED